MRRTMLFLKVWWRENVLYGGAVTRNPWRNLFNYPFSNPIFFAWSPPTPTLKPQMPPSQMSPDPNHPPRTHRHTERSLFCVLQKKSPRIKRSKMFNYNIMYTISITIVTIGNKFVERIFDSSNGALFWNHWKNSGPLPTNGGNLIIKLMLLKTKKCKVPNIQERKKLFR